MVWPTEEHQTVLLVKLSFYLFVDVMIKSCKSRDTYVGWSRAPAGRKSPFPGSVLHMLEMIAKRGGHCGSASPADCALAMYYSTQGARILLSYAIHSDRMRVSQKTARASVSMANLSLLVLKVIRKPRILSLIRTTRLTLQEQLRKAQLHELSHRDSRVAISSDPDRLCFVTTMILCLQKLVQARNVCEHTV